MSQKLINLALRRNIFYPAGEIYPNSPAGFYNFGPVGLKIKNNLIEFWRRELVEEESALEISGAQILGEDIWKASGHLKSFNDPVVRCTKCSSFVRADKILEEAGEEVGEKTDLKIIDELILKHNLKCTKCSSNYSKATTFNLMFKTYAGVGESNPIYLRGEACQNIFLDFKRIYTNARTNLPLSIAQVGRAFRNEISPRNGLIRVREFDQMDVEVFFNPEELDSYNVDDYMDIKLPVFLVDSKSEIEFKTVKELKNEGYLKYNIEIYYLIKMYNFFEKMGLDMSKFRFKQVSADDRPFYSLATWDPEALVSDAGWVEIMAFNYRTDHDLGGHMKGSKVDLHVMSHDKKVMPYILELSMGTDRIFYALLDHSIEERDSKLILKLRSSLMPYEVAIFPLVKKGPILEKTTNLHNELKKCNFKIIYDQKGSIGKRYARVDEIGVRYAITIDYDSVEDDAVTLRDSFTGNQERVKISDIKDKLFSLKYSE